MSDDTIGTMLYASFPKKHVGALLRHFKKAADECQNSHWEDCIAKAGKFIEAVLKALYVCAQHQPAPSGKAFKADSIINTLHGLQQGSADDTIRILIPRACRFVYEVASNRGGRHDPDEIDPNEMDATTAMSLCSWILAEMIRFAQKGAVDLAAAKTAISQLLEKKFPLVEDIDGRIYFHGRNKSAPDVAIVALAHKHPARVRKAALIDIVKRNGFTEANAKVAVSRIMRVRRQPSSGDGRAASGFSPSRASTCS